MIEYDIIFIIGYIVLLLSGLEIMLLISGICDTPLRKKWFEWYDFLNMIICFVSMFILVSVGLLMAYFNGGIM